MTLIIVDQQEITRWAIRKMALEFAICPPEQISSVNSFSGLKNALETAKREQEASIVVLDYSSINCTEDELLVLSMRHTAAHFILFSEHLSRDFLRRTLLGSTSFSVVLKDSPVQYISDCLHEVSKGRQYICPSIQSLLDTPEKAESEMSPLTATEREILKALALGQSTKEIASKRFLSVYTVMTHRKNIFRKLHVNNAQEAIRYALRAGIVDPLEYYI